MTVSINWGADVELMWHIWKNKDKTRDMQPPENVRTTKQEKKHKKKETKRYKPEGGKIMPFTHQYMGWDIFFNMIKKK